MPKVLGRGKLWGKGYTTVPVLVRRLLDISEGSEIEWVLNDDGSIGVRKVG
jgi:bifunctional DNA-binding transcriptional regulator/antitoxin component of YhaV-PrlF toxin-antitoxin module